MIEFFRDRRMNYPTKFKRPWRYKAGCATQYKARIQKHVQTIAFLDSLSFDSGNRGEGLEKERGSRAWWRRVSISAEAASHFAPRARARGLLWELQGRRNASPARMPPRGRIRQGRPATYSISSTWIFLIAPVRTKIIER